MSGCCEGSRACHMEGAPSEKGQEGQGTRLGCEIKCQRKEGQEVGLEKASKRWIMMDLM